MSTQTEGKVYINQKLRLILETELDLTGQTAAKIKALDPNGDAHEWDATVDDEPSGEMYKDFTTGDITIPDVWTFWSWAAFDSDGVSDAIPGEPVKIKFYEQGR